MRGDDRSTRAHFDKKVHFCFDDGEGTLVQETHPQVPQAVPPGDRPFAVDDHAWDCSGFPQGQAQHLLGQGEPARGAVKRTVLGIS
jgi:hypothetical protein